MTKKRILVSIVVVAILAALIYSQYHTWRKFDWTTFRSETSNVRWTYIVIGVLLIYGADVIRALRWKIFLRPVCNARFRDLVAPQFIGFTGLALLGRPGELVRPYIIAKKTGLSVSSQMAVWAVERIFDIAGFTALLVVAIFAFGNRLPFPGKLRDAGYALVGIVAVMAIAAWLIRRFGPALATWAEGHMDRRAPHLAHSVSSKIRAFGEGLNTIPNVAAFLEVSALSVVIWFIIALAYRFVMHAYIGTPLAHLGVPGVTLIMGSSMVGSLLQLPAVGGGTQLATISMMARGFASENFADPSRGLNIPIELATSAGILLWLVTFVSVVPLGLAIAHREHVSLRELSKEAELEESAPLASSADTSPRA
jgi:glycosyltransferase 2 family protein